VSEDPKPSATTPFLRDEAVHLERANEFDIVFSGEKVASGKVRRITAHFLVGEIVAQTPLNPGDWQACEIVIRFGSKPAYSGPAQLAKLVNTGNSFIAEWSLQGQWQHPTSSTTSTGAATEAISPFLMSAPFIQHIYAKPLGYAGDFGALKKLLGDPYEGHTLFAKMINAWLVTTPAGDAYRHRVQTLTRRAGGWAVDGQAFDVVVLACTAAEAARLARPHAPEWSELAASLRHQSILTTYVRCDGARLPHHPMARLDAGPAQFAFDHGWLSGHPGLFAFVASAADPWMEQGIEGAEAAMLRQARDFLRTCAAAGPPRLVHSVCERRATFACTAGLRRPPAAVAPGLWAAADFVAGPYPATLEGAVRSGEATARAATGLEIETR
jgi:hypothetical protein